MEVEDLGQHISRRFNEDLEHTTPVSYEEWRRRPLHVRMLDDFFYRFHRLL